MSRGRTPSVSGKAAATSLGDGSFARKEADASSKENSEADLAYTRAVEACNRIIRELDEILKGSKYDGKHHEPSDA